MLSLFANQVLQLAKKNPRIVVLNGDDQEESGLLEFAKHFPGQFYQFGLSTEAMIASAAGMALRKKIPIITGRANDLFRAYSEIRSLIAYPNLNVKFVYRGAGLAGDASVPGQSPANVCFEDLALLRTLPDVKIAAPADAKEAKAALEESVNEIGPCFLRLFDQKKEIFKHRVDFKFGDSQAIKDGEDLCIFTCGKMVETALAVAKHFENKLKSVAVVNLSSIMPVDVDLILNYAESVKNCVVLEDHSVLGGLGSIVAEVLSTNSPTELLMIGVEDRRLKFGKSGDLENLYGIDFDSIVEKIAKIC